jgi:hypothetical protein
MSFLLIFGMPNEAEWIQMEIIAEYVHSLKKDFFSSMYTDWCYIIL